MPDLIKVYAGLLRARALVADLDRTDKVADRHQVAAGVRHELDTGIRWAHDELERLRALAADDRPGKVRADATETSRRTAERITVKAGTRRFAVLCALYEAAPAGLTDFEIQAKARLGPSTERPRRGELVDAGLVRPTEQTRKHNGEDWRVWVITTSGVTAARAAWPSLPPVVFDLNAIEQPGLF